MFPWSPLLDTKQFLSSLNCSDDGTPSKKKHKDESISWRNFRGRRFTYYFACSSSLKLEVKPMIVILFFLRMGYRDCRFFSRARFLCERRSQFEFFTYEMKKRFTGKYCAEKIWVIVRLFQQSKKKNRDLLFFSKTVTMIKMIIISQAEAS